MEFINNITSYFGGETTTDPSEVVKTEIASYLEGKENTKETKDVLYKLYSDRLLVITKRAMENALYKKDLSYIKAVKELNGSWDFYDDTTYANDDCDSDCSSNCDYAPYETKFGDIVVELKDPEIFDYFTADLEELGYDIYEQFSPNIFKLCLFYYNEHIAKAVYKMFVDDRNDSVIETIITRGRLELLKFIYEDLDKKDLFANMSSLVNCAINNRQENILEFLLSLDGTVEISGPTIQSLIYAKRLDTIKWCIANKNLIGDSVLNRVYQIGSHKDVIDYFMNQDTLKFALTDGAIMELARNNDITTLEKLVKNPNLISRKLGYYQCMELIVSARLDIIKWIIGNEHHRSLFFNDVKMTSNVSPTLCQDKNKEKLDYLVKSEIIPKSALEKTLRKDQIWLYEYMKQNQ